MVDCTTPKQCDMLVAWLWYPVTHDEESDISLIITWNRDSLYFKEYNQRIEDLVYTLTDLNPFGFNFYNAIVIDDLQIDCSDFYKMTEEERQVNTRFILAEMEIKENLYKKNITRIDFIRKEEGKFIGSKKMDDYLTLNWKAIDLYYCGKCGWRDRESDIKLFSLYK